MQDMEKPKFEESWKEAFDQAEFNPSDKVWTNIELDLEKEKNDRLNRKLIFYQSLAAACVGLMLVAGIFIYTRADKQVSNQLLASRPGHEFSKNSDVSQHNNRDEKTEKSIAKQSNKNLSDSTSNHIMSSAPKNDLSQGNKTQLNLDKGNHGQIINSVIASKKENTRFESENNFDAVYSPLLERPTTPIVNIYKPRLNILNIQTEPDAVTKMMARLEAREKEFTEKETNDKKTHEEKLWTSIGIAAGSFNSIASAGNLQGQNSALQSDAFNFSAGRASNNTSALADVAEKEARASGITYSVGINLGTKLSRRWIIQGGLNYLTQSSEYSQQVMIPNADNSKFRPAIYDDYRKSSSSANVQQESLVFTAPHDVNTDVKYLSIPLQAGYLIINKTVGLQLNAGVATDVFLQSTTTATANGEKVKIDPSKANYSENSAFRPVNLSGLMGTEVSYKLGKYYRISLNPGVRYPLKSIYKSDDYTTTRISLDLGLRFRYIFH